MDAKKQARMVCEIPETEEEAIGHTKYRRGQNPNSLAVLKDPTTKRKPDWEEKKKKRFLTVSEKGWEGAKEAVARLTGTDPEKASVSDFLERVGRGEIICGYARRLSSD